jgi:hypothetical protein
MDCWTFLLMQEFTKVTGKHNFKTKITSQKLQLCF